MLPPCLMSESAEIIKKTPNGIVKSQVVYGLAQWPYETDQKSNTGTHQYYSWEPLHSQLIITVITIDPNHHPVALDRTSSFAPPPVSPHPPPSDPVAGPRAAWRSCGPWTSKSGCW